MAVSKICFPCHEDKEKQITKAKFKHGPIRDNGCAQCHLPHGSKNRMLLRSKFTGEFSAEFSMDNYELCFNCHETTMVLKEKTNNTTGFRNGKTNLHYLHVNTQGRNCIFTLKYKKTENGGRCIDGCHKPRKYDRINPIINK
jgi:predicted CXXCH cytochrome family protein